MDKVIPSAVKVEQTVLGAIMISSEAMGQICDLITSKAFYDNRHYKIYAAAMRLFQKTKPIDLVTIAEELKSSKDLEKIGGAFYLVELTNMVGSAANIEHHARILLQKQMRRELIEAGHDIINRAFSEEYDVLESLERAEQKVFDIAASKTNSGVGHISQFGLESFKNLERIATRKDDVSGLSTGFVDLDGLTSGLQPSDLIIIAARPGMGKTALVVSIAENICGKMKIPAVMFSLEMSSVQLANRFLSIQTGIPSSKLRTAKLESYEWQGLNDAIEKLPDVPFFIDDTPGITAYEIRAKCRRLKMKHDIQLVIIDYMQLMTGEGRGMNREQQVSQMSRSLKCLAKELNVPVVALSQLSRAVEIRGGTKRPQLSDLRESGSIEQDADIVGFVYRPEYYNIIEDEEGQSLRGVAEIIIAKHRNGALKTVKAKFNPNLAHFSDFESGLIQIRGEEPPF